MSKYFVSISFLLTSLAACTDKISYNSSSLLVNQSTHDATFKFYKLGVENGERRIESLKDSSLEIYTDQNDGEGPGENFLDIIAGFQFDSVLVEFDTGVKLVNYGAGVTTTNPNAFDFTHPRNFLNDSNWTLETLSKGKKRLEYEYEYKITQEDFLMAK
jgi:hypothetical protein